MPPALAAVAALVVLAIAAQWFSHRNRQNLLAAIRANWGKPGVRVRKMDAIAEYHRSIVLARGPGCSLDDRTWTDLDMDAVFQSLDRTESTLGQQVLYQRLRRQGAGDLNQFEQLVERLSHDAPTRERIQMALAGLREPDGYDLWWLAQADALVRPRWHLAFAAWAAIVLGAVAAIPWWPSAILVPVAGAAINLAIRTRTVWRVSSMIGPFRQVSALVSAAHTVRDANLPGPSAETLLRDLPAIARLAAIARWVGRDPSKSNELVAGFWEYLNLLFLLDINALSLASGQLRACGPALLRVICAVGEVDAAISVASLRAGTDGWVRPSFQSSWRQAVIGGLRHPLVVDAVPNSITLGPPFGVLVTGSNMSGKSTFLRTVGVTAVMAQSINTCFATDYRAPIVAVQSCIGRSDDLAAGKSHYIVEVDEVLSRVNASASAEPHLFLFDELFRGTNAVERIAAGEAVLRELLRDPGDGRKHVVLAATHDAELVELLGGDYEACHFADSIGPEGLSFDHRRAPGPATTRNAITLLELHGAPPSVVASALARAAELDRSRSRVL
ncbi:MAG: hypothetical protein Q8O42_13430 [Acidobacteriota bacterium]|nr:hypothetical protein [Acidobacteriota bacterium]